MVTISGAGAVETTDDGMAGPVLNATDATRFSALTDRGNYLAQDPLDIQFAVKEIARRMASPRRGDMLLLKRLARYLVGAPRAVYTYPWQSQSARLEVYEDSDWPAAEAPGAARPGEW